MADDSIERFPIQDEEQPRRNCTERCASDVRRSAQLAETKQAGNCQDDRDKCDKSAEFTNQTHKEDQS